MSGADASKAIFIALQFEFGLLLLSTVVEVPVLGELDKSEGDTDELEALDATEIAEAAGDLGKGGNGGTGGAL